MAWKFFDVGDQLCSSRRGCGATDAASKGDGLACHLPKSEDQLLIFHHLISSSAIHLIPREGGKCDRVLTIKKEKTDFPMKRSEDQLLRDHRVEDIKAGPVDLGAGGGEGMEREPEEGGGVGRVTFMALASKSVIGH